MRFMRVPVIATLALCTLGAASAQDITSTNWEFPSVTSRSKAKAKKLGKTKGAKFEQVEVQLHDDGQFDATVAGLDLSGTWTRKKPGAKVARLELDAPSLAAIADKYEDEIETALATEGYDIDLDLFVTAQRVKMKVKFRKKAGTAVANLSARFKLVGTATGEGVVGVPARLKGRLKGKSTEVSVE